MINELVKLLLASSQSLNGQFYGEGNTIQLGLTGTRDAAGFGGTFATDDITIRPVLLLAPTNNPAFFTDDLDVEATLTIQPINNPQFYTATEGNLVSFSFSG